MVTESLKQYIDNSILPMYDDISCQREQSQACLSYAERSRDWSVRQFDAAHQRDHVDMVIEQSLEIARQHDVNLDSPNAARLEALRKIIRDEQDVLPKGTYQRCKYVYNYTWLHRVDWANG